MIDRPRSPQIRRALERARRVGYAVTFRRWVEDARTPGLFPGQIAGRCDYERREIVIGTHAGDRARTRAQIAAILEHECEHAEGATVATDRPECGLFCGNKAGHYAR